MWIIFRQSLMDLRGVGGFLLSFPLIPDISCRFCQWSLWKNGWQRYSIYWPIFLETNLSNQLLGSSSQVTLIWLWWQPDCPLPLHIQCWFEKHNEPVLFFFFSSTSWIMWFCKQIPSTRISTTKNLHRKTHAECVLNLYIVMKLHYVPYSKWNENSLRVCACVCACVRVRACSMGAFSLALKF